MNSKIVQEAIEWLKSFSFALIVVGSLSIFVTPTMVYSVSMYPTLMEKDVLVLQKGHDFDRGDIVSFKSEITLSESDISRMNSIQQLLVDTDTKKNLIKRVIAIPGDSIKIVDGKVYVNGELINEWFVSSPTTGQIDISKIPSGYYFLMGDNRSQSLDSRNYEVGLIEKDKLIGKAIFRVLPLNKIGQMQTEK